MTRIALFCKSYSTDLKRVHRLLSSIQRFNIDKLPVFISAPSNELKLFESHLKGLKATILADEDITSSNSMINASKLRELPGNISQQIVKSEFWRLGLCENYICLDSDAYFIREFTESCFISSNGTPYTVVDQCQELFLSALRKKKHKVISDYQLSSRTVASEFKRSGPDYSFGPMPIWASKVWKSLDENYAIKNKKSFLDLIIQHPHELRWYGEALLAYNAIPIIPIQPQFRTYHYHWQLKEDENHGVSNDELKNIYLGVVHQSAWERELDWPAETGSLTSKISRRLKKILNKM